MPNNCSLSFLSRPFKYFNMLNENFAKESEFLPAVARSRLGWRLLTMILAISFKVDSVGAVVPIL